VEPIPVDLSGVAETLLGNLGRRAASARRGALQEPMREQVLPVPVIAVLEAGLAAIRMSRAGRAQSP
jgi:hypothetical protein